MPRCGNHGWLPFAGLAILLTGCSAPPPPQFEVWAPQEAAYTPSPNSGNAYDGYVVAAREAESLAGELSAYVSFAGKHKSSLMKRIAPAVQKMRKAADLSCDVRFVTPTPFAPAPNHSGWRLIRYSLIWQLEEAVAKGDFDSAIGLVVVATKIGFDLTGGAAADADLGLQYVDEARRTIAPYIQDLSQVQLSRLTTGLKKALGALPTFDRIAQNEGKNYRRAIQWVQDNYQGNKFEEIDSVLGTSVRDAVTYLKQVKKDDTQKRPAYFQGFADEAEQVVDWQTAQAALAVVKRKADKEMPLAKERPWRRFSASLFTTLRPILSRYDATLARTRLLILTGEIHRQIKAARKAPSSLSAFSQDLTIDPYSGQLFKYRANNMEFFIYSVGSNFQDDQASTDSTYSVPDLTLETSRR